MDLLLATESHGPWRHGRHGMEAWSTWLLLVFKIVRVLEVPEVPRHHGYVLAYLAFVATRLTLRPGVHEPVGQILPLNMLWTPLGPPGDDPARHKSIIIF